MLQGHQRLLVAHHRLAVGRAVLGFVPRLAAIGQGFVPDLAPQGMLRQPSTWSSRRSLARPPAPRRCARATRAAARAADSRGHLMGEGVLEGVGALGKQTGLVEELRRLQLRQARYSASSGVSAIAWSSGPGTSVPMTAAVWSKRLSSGGSRSRRAASSACTVAGACKVSSGCARR